MLAGSVAKTIAAHDADGALERGDALGERLERLVGARANTRWYQRTRRAELEQRIAACKHELSTPAGAAEHASSVRTSRVRDVIRSPASTAIAAAMPGAA